MKEIVAILTAVFILFNCSYAEMSFTSLGDLAGGSYYSQAWDVSSDGSTVVGSSLTVIGREAFRWTQAEGMMSLGGVADPDCVSADGSVIVGIGAGNLAFRWTQESGMVSLGDLSGGIALSRATGVSTDGTTITGWSSSTSGNQAFRWTQADGMVGLGDLPGGGFRSIASSISADGSTIVGYGASDTLSSEAFRWTQAEGMVGLGVNGDARAVSVDGSVIAGVFDSAWRWSASDGAIELGLFPANSNSYFYVSDMSANGSILAGQGELVEGAGEAAIIWDEINGYQSLQDILVDGGIDMTGWTLTKARGLSADGKTIVGTATNPSGRPEAFIAVIPEPASAIMLLLVGGGGLFIRRLFLI